MASQQSAGDPRRSGNPARRSAARGGAGQPGAARQPRASNAARRGLADRSRPLLLRLSALPPLAIPGLILALMLVGLVAPLPIALAALGVIVLFVLWLAFLSWPVLDTRGKLMRGIMLGLVVGAGVARTQGWL